MIDKIRWSDTCDGMGWDGMARGEGGVYMVLVGWLFGLFVWFGMRGVERKGEGLISSARF